MNPTKNKRSIFATMTLACACILCGVLFSSFASASVASITWPQVPTNQMTGGVISSVLSKILLDDNMLAMNGSGIVNKGIVENANSLMGASGNRVMKVHQWSVGSLIDDIRYANYVVFGSGSSASPTASYGLIGDAYSKTGANIFEFRAMGGAGYSYDARISSYSTNLARGASMNIDGDAKKITLKGWGGGADGLSRDEASVDITGDLNVSNSICLRGACITQWPNPLTSSAQFTPITKLLRPDGTMILPSNLSTEEASALRFFPQNGILNDIFYDDGSGTAEGLKIPVTTQLVDAVGYSGSATNWFTIGVDPKRSAYDATSTRMITLVSGSFIAGNHDGVISVGNSSAVGVDNAKVYTDNKSSFIYCGYLLEEYSEAGVRLSRRQTTTTNYEKCDTIRWYDSDNVLLWSGATMDGAPEFKHGTLEYPIRHYSCDPSEPDQVADLFIEVAMVPLINRDNSSGDKSQAQNNLTDASSCDFVSGYASVIRTGDNENPNDMTSIQGAPVTQTVPASCANQSVGRQLIARFVLRPKTKLSEGACIMPTNIRNYVSAHNTRFTRATTPAPGSLDESTGYPARVYIDSFGTYSIK